MQCGTHPTFSLQHIIPELLISAELRIEQYAQKLNRPQIVLRLLLI
jgi:hypothetical protein